MILLDTNVLSELTKPRPSPSVVAWLEANEPMLALPAIALAELRYGIARLPDGPLRSVRHTNGQPLGVTSVQPASQA